MTKKKVNLPQRDARGRFISLFTEDKPKRKSRSRSPKKTAVTAPSTTLDLAFTIDTTGSMSPIRNQVRNELKLTIKYLLKHIPNLRVAIISHGDYCDRSSGVDFMSVQDFTADEHTLEHFLSIAPNTGGGDPEEAYEAVLNRVRYLSWRPDSRRSLVLIGDELPHEVGYYIPGGGRLTLNWKNETAALRDIGVTIYPTQCLQKPHANHFYDELAKMSGTTKVELAQYSDVNGVLMAIAMKQAGQLDQYESDTKGQLSFQQERIVASLAGRKFEPIKKTALSAFAVHPSRFQMFIVKNKMRIDNFIEEQGLVYGIGGAYYEFTKPEEVQAHKEVVVQDRTTGEMFAGTKAKEILDIPLTGVDVKIKPKNLAETLVKYAGFIQSTSLNRILVPGTRVLYDTRHSI